VKETEADLNLTRTGRGLGTPHFMSPEQFRNAKNADVRCDIYSLGATLYMMVTGELPFGNCNGPLDAWMKKTQNDIAPPRKLVPKLSERTEAAIQRSMHPDAKVRQASCQEFVADLAGKGDVPKPAVPGASSAPPDVWYLIYKDDEGTTHTVKGSTAGIRRSYQEGLLGDASNIRASRSKTGNFEPLLGLPEFRDLAPSDGAAPPEEEDAEPRSSTKLSTPRSNSSIQSKAKSHQSDPAPHIPIQSGDPGIPEWLKNVVIALVAMVAGMCIIYFFNKFSH
jgi:serine/threonine protein kinase